MPKYRGSCRYCSLLVPASRYIGRRYCGGTPAHAVYNCSLPIGMPMPLAPKSPRPRIRPELVTQITRTSLTGQLRSTSLTCPFRLIDNVEEAGRVRHQGMIKKRLVRLELIHQVNKPVEIGGLFLELQQHTTELRLDRLGYIRAQFD